MTEKTYTIKPLEWVKTRDNSYRADITFGSFSVYIPDDSTVPYWEYCFVEYYDEGYSECATIEEGKKRAENLYLDRILRCLDEVIEVKE